MQTAFVLENLNPLFEAHCDILSGACCNSVLISLLCAIWRSSANNDAKTSFGITDANELILIANSVTFRMLPCGTHVPCWHVLDLVLFTVFSLINSRIYIGNLPLSPCWCMSFNLQYLHVVSYALSKSKKVQTVYFPSTNACFINVSSMIR